LALARRRATSVCLEARSFRDIQGDLDDPASRPLRILDLDLQFNRICTRAEEDRWRARWNLSRNFRLPPRWFHFYVENAFIYDSGFLDLPDGTCLRGYFQSERYFDEIKADIRTAFQPRDPYLLSKVDPQLQKLRQKSQVLVAVHVRRGDFLELPERDCLTNDQFLDAAMAMFPGAHFLIFSDDLNWCRARFSVRQDVSFSPFTRVLEDFFAISRCDHHILAKSTFSWWAAWLSKSPNQKVVAPRIKQDLTWAGASPDYYPKEWTVLG